jgi:hypothetical protein
VNLFHNNTSLRQVLWEAVVICIGTARLGACHDTQAPAAICDTRAGTAGRSPWRVSRHAPTARYRPMRYAHTASVARYRCAIRGLIHEMLLTHRPKHGTLTDGSMESPLDAAD